MTLNPGGREMAARQFTVMQGRVYWRLRVTKETHIVTGLPGRADAGVVDHRPYALQVRVNTTGAVQMINELLPG